MTTYIVTQDGSVWNNDRARFLKPWTQSSGYLQVNLWGKCKLVHRLVAEAYIPNPEGFDTVDHIDFNRQNNCVENLRWMSNRENCVRKRCM